MFNNISYYMEIIFNIFEIELGLFILNDFN